MGRYVRREAMLRIGDGKGDYVLVGRDGDAKEEYLARGWKIEEEIPESTIDTANVPQPTPRRDVAPPKTEDEHDDGEQPPLPGIDVAHRRKLKKAAGA